MRNVAVIPTLLFVMLMAAGCSRTIVQADNPTPIGASEYRETYEAAIWVLRDHGFTIDRRDHRFGTVTSLPLGSPNLFEVWDDQNTTRGQAVESTLASEQRRVIVKITVPDGDGGSGQSGFEAGYMLEVEVVLERRQVPTRRMAGSARRNVFSNLAAPPKDLIERGVTGSYWEVAGRDPLLEARLIKQILGRVEQTTDSP
jgi:hypothetical protein